MSHNKEIQAAITALNDWRYTYAESECYPERVQEAKNRINDNCGTICYIAQVRGDLEKLLD